MPPTLICPHDYLIHVFIQWVDHLRPNVTVRVSESMASYTFSNPPQYIIEMMQALSVKKIVHALKL